MSTKPRPTPALDQTLLARLSALGVKRASELPPCPAPRPAPREALRPSIFERLFPASALVRTGQAAPCRLVTRSTPLDGQAGEGGYRCPVLPWGGPPDPGALAALTGQPEWAQVDPGRVLYIDTETTGLATGAGTVAFLVGLGWFEDGRFVVEQYFMEDYDAEEALVEAVDRSLAAAQAVVSYNGATFDLPLLAARWTMQGRRPPRPRLHLDLLHASRRLWRGRLPNCSLGTVERHILGIERASDVPGAQVPQIYFDYLHGRAPERIAVVLDHHAQDIFSLGALASALACAVAQPGDSRFAHASDQAGLARIWEDRGDFTRADERLTAAQRAAAEDDPALTHELAMHRALLYKRQGMWDQALALWEELAPQARPGRLDALVELAKHAEHRQRDYEAAAAWTRRALEILNSNAELAALIGRAASSFHQEAIGQLQHRHARLQRKLTAAQ